MTCGFALRNLVDLAAFFTELGRVVRPGGRIALLDVGIPRNRIVRFGNGIYFGQVVPRIGALLSDGAAYRYLPRSVAYLPAPAEMVAMLRQAGFADAAHAQLSGGITQLLTGDPRARAVTCVADDATAALDLNDIARDDGFLFVRQGVGLAGRGVAARIPVSRGARRRWQPSSTTTAAAPVSRPSPSAGCRSTPPPTARSSSRPSPLRKLDRRPAPRHRHRRRHRGARRTAGAAADRIGVHDRTRHARRAVPRGRGLRP